MRMWRRWLDRLPVLFGLRPPVSPRPVAQPIAPRAYQTLSEVEQAQPVSPDPVAASAASVHGESAGQRIGRAFAPSRPIDSPHNLVGRNGELNRILAAMQAQRMHVVLFGPRGYGKTSLAKVLAEVARQEQFNVIYGVCSASASFAELLRFYLRQTPATGTGLLDPVSGSGSLAAIAGAEDMTPRNIARLMATLRGGRFIYILDEYDRIEDPQTHRQTSELLKDLADIGAPVLLVLVGVADNVQDLLGYVPSVHRNILCIGLTRLPGSEAGQILDRGAAEAALVFAPDVRAALLDICQGSAYHLQLFGLYCCLAAYNAETATITAAVLGHAIDQALREWALVDLTSSQLLDEVRHAPRQFHALAIMARACLMNQDSFSLPEATVIVEKQEAAVSDAVSVQLLQAQMRRLARDIGVLQFDPLRSNKLHKRYRFRNHLAPQFLLAAYWRHCRDLHIAPPEPAASGQ